jgi:hypothetical protein
MGCWNGTCGLSGLPILHGDEIYVFPIVENSSDSFCYASALYRANAMPFQAVYNDYGGGEQCSGPGLDIVISGIAEQLVELEMGEHQYHDIEVKREGFDANKFFDAVHEGRLLFKNPMRVYEGNSEHVNVYFTMIRKDVIDRLWNEWTFDQWKGSAGTVPEGFESDQYYVKNVTYARLAELIPDYMDTMTNKFPGRDKILEGLTGEDLAIMEDFLRRDLFFQIRDDHLLTDIFKHAFGSGYAGGGFAKIGKSKEEIIGAYFDDRNEEATALLREVMVTSMVNSFMEHTRKVWLPSMHQGSQSECLDEYRLMNKITDDIIAQREAKFAEYD